MLFAALLSLFPSPYSLVPTASAQQTQAPSPIAYVPTEGVTLSGSLEVANGKAVIGNNGSITAGDKTATVTLGARRHAPALLDNHRPSLPRPLHRRRLSPAR